MSWVLQLGNHFWLTAHQELCFRTFWRAKGFEADSTSLTAGLMKSGFHAILRLEWQIYLEGDLEIFFCIAYFQCKKKASHGESQLPGQPRWPNASWRRYTKPQSSTGLDTDRNISNIYKYMIFSVNNLHLYSDLKSGLQFFPNRNSALFSRSCILYSSDALPVDLQDLAGSIAFDGCAADLGTAKKSSKCPSFGHVPSPFLPLTWWFEAGGRI